MQNKTHTHMDGDPEWQMGQYHIFPLGGHDL